MEGGGKIRFDPSWQRDTRFGPFVVKEPLSRDYTAAREGRKRFFRENAFWVAGGACRVSGGFVALHP